jgi:hypothetical protein
MDCSEEPVYTDEPGNDFIDHARSPGDRSGGDAVGVPRIARHHRGSPGRNWVDPALQNVPSLSGWEIAPYLTT